MAIILIALTSIDLFVNIVKERIIHSIHIVKSVITCYQSYLSITSDKFSTLEYLFIILTFYLIFRISIYIHF